MDRVLLLESIGSIFLLLAFLAVRYIKDLVLMKIVVAHCMGLALFLGFVAAVTTNPNGVAFLVTCLVFLAIARWRPARPRLHPVRI